MALLGQAAIAMWWDVAAEWQQEFEDWHTHEPFPERMGIPGFLRGARWASADGGPGCFVMDELDGHETLSSEACLARLNRPSPWSTQLMPQHRNMVRSQCRLLSSAGGGIGRCAMTLRLGPQDGLGDPRRPGPGGGLGLRGHRLRRRSVAPAASGRTRRRRLVRPWGHAQHHDGPVPALVRGDACGLRVRMNRSG